jgi:hypothetical protein
MIQTYFVASNPFDSIKLAIKSRVVLMADASEKDMIFKNIGTGKYLTEIDFSSPKYTLKQDLSCYPYGIKDHPRLFLKNHPIVLIQDSYFVVDIYAGQTYNVPEIYVNKNQC